MEELGEKIEQVLGSVAASSSAGSGVSLSTGGGLHVSKQRGSRFVVARLTDGSQEVVELTPDLRFCVGDDAERLKEHLRLLRGMDVEAVEMPKAPPYKEMLQWAETLSAAFMKAWMQRAEPVDFMEKVCLCGEGLIGYRQHALAYLEVYARFSDRCQGVKDKLVPGKAVDDQVWHRRAISVVARFKLGRCLALYQQTIRKDEGAKRRDTVETLRDVLRDILNAVKFVNQWEVGVREDMYWAVYNSCVLALRVARWLRLHGFGGACVQSLSWLAQCANASLPMMAVHMVPMRARFYIEQIYCAESAMQLVEASRLCEVALEQLDKDKKLETMLQPVPEETVQVFDTAITRVRVLKIKYDFWLEKSTGEGKTVVVFDTKQVVAQGEALGAQWALPTLLEVLELQHGLPQHFGASPAGDLEAGARAAAAAPQEGAPQVTKMSLEKIRSKQSELLLAILERMHPHLEKVEEATKALEEFTARRTAFEAEEERRARSEEGGQAEAQEPLVAPERPSAEQLSAWGFGAASPNHVLEEMLPLATHTMLARECLRREMRDAGGPFGGKFAELQKSLALRLRYRHFFSPPLIDVDVTVSPHKSRDSVGLPDKYDFLTDDLNANSIKNRRLDADASGVMGSDASPQNGGRAAPQRPGTAKPAGKHVYVIGRRFDAWEGWAAGGPRIRRLCNLRVGFGRQAPARGVGFGDVAATAPAPAEAGQSSKPWSSPYAYACADDSSGFDHLGPSGRLRDDIAEQLTAEGHLRPQSLPLPIEPHPGSKKGEGVQPYLMFSVYDESKLEVCDEQAEVNEKKKKKLAKSVPAAAQPTLLPAEIEDGQKVEEAAVQDEMPPWCPLIDAARCGAAALLDLSIFATKHLHAPAKGPVAPSSRFNAMLRTDLRQTPPELLGRPFQSYIFVCGAVAAPAVPFVERQLRVLRAFAAVHRAVTAPDEAGDGEEHAERVEPWQRPAVLEGIAELGKCLEQVVSGSSGQLFLLDAADFLEDVCAHAFLQWLWPRFHSIQEAHAQEEVFERMRSDREAADLAKWSSLLRRVLPQVLRILEEVRALDAMTLGSAAVALARLFHRENDAKTGQVELGMAIARLEDDLAEASIPGPQPKLDQHTGAAVSFDPPSIRPPDHALFDGPGPAAMGGARECTLLLKALPRSLQDRFCLLTRLYEAWLDLSLKVHKKNVGSATKRARLPGASAEEEGTLIGAGGGSTKLSLSNQEALVLGRLGENPYLRAIFFVAVARRRPDVAAVALGKACQEIEAAVQQERQLWEFCEQVIVKQQMTMRTGGGFGDEFRGKAQRKADKPRASPAIPFGRAPGVVRMRLPPLINSTVPPLLPSGIDLKPAEQAFSIAKHSERFGTRSAAATVLTCALYGKTAGTGTSVSEMHRDLVGTGLRHFGYDYVEVTGLKPNTNYSFATMYFEGFEASRPAASAISETSPPIGAYFPLPLVLLRIEIYREAVKAGEAIAARAWAPLFDQMCERAAPCESFDACGLRSYKLRLDVADRMPPAILAAFAEVLLLRNGAADDRRAEALPATKPTQQAALRGANECLIAADAARRSGCGRLLLRSISAALRLLGRLLQFRTKPPVLLSLLTRCAASLQKFDPKEEDRTATWYAKARVMSTYLFHQIIVLCVQLRQTDALAKQIAADAPQRYSAHQLARAGAQVVAGARLLDKSVELALLGTDFWEQAEAKAQVALRDHPSAAELTSLLKDLSGKDYVKVATDASKIAFGEGEERHPLALALMRCAAKRSWRKEETQAALSSVLDQHPLAAAMDGVLAEAKKRFSDFGFMLRALPPRRIALPLPPPEEAPPSEEAAALASGAASPRSVEKKQSPRGAAAAPPPAAAAPAPADEEGAGAEPKPTPSEVLAGSEDSAGLAQLEMLRAGFFLHELCTLRFHYQDISRFKFFDLQQVAVPDLVADGATQGGIDPLAATAPTEPPPADGEGEAAAGDAEPNAEVESWQAKDEENSKNRARAFELLRELMPKVVRGAAYASAARADQLLQSMLLVALNALLVACPSPVECVPKGAQSNPEDIDPDKFVGRGAEEAAERAEGEAQAEEGAKTDLWLQLAILADLAVEALQRLKSELAPPPPRPALAAPAQKHKPSAKSGAKRGQPPPKDPAAETDEDKAAKVARETAAELGAADEELHDMWFEKMPELDITSFAKMVAYAALCLYHMRRWDNVVALCRSFNDATCFAFATTFLPLMIGAQSQVCYLANRAISNTKRYMDESKATFDVEQGQVSRKEMRQLALAGELSKPEKLYKKRVAYYGDILKRQGTLRVVWEQLLKALDSSRALVAKAVPAAVEQLRKSRILMAEFLQDRQNFGFRASRGQLAPGEKMARARALKLACVALMSSYRKSVELLRKRQMSDLVVQALHELGNLQWLEGDASGAQTSWSDAMDTTYQHVYAIKNWQKCAESAVTPPKTAARTELMLLSVIILAKHARLTMPKDNAAHLHSALFASAILEAILTSSLPHPSHRKSFSLDKYRLREVFLGLRESRLLLPPSSVHGGVDGAMFLGCLEFFHNTLLTVTYQTARCLPMCNLYNYVATDICRSPSYVVRGRLMMARALISTGSLDSAWLALHQLAGGQDAPRALLDGEALDQAIQEGHDSAVYRTDEEPTSEHNKKAVARVLEFALPGDDAASAVGQHNVNTFKFVQAEFLLRVASHGVAAKPVSPEATERAAWLEKASTLLRALWKEVTGSDDDVANLKGLAAGNVDVPAPAMDLGEQESELCVEIRALLSKAAEHRGDLNVAAAEAVYAMRFVRLLSKVGVRSASDCSMGGAAQLRTHPASRMWMMLRRRLVHVLVLQGRLQAADAHIEQGLQECQSANDDVTRVDLLAAKLRVNALQGRLLELRGDRRIGGIPAARCCIELAAKRLPAPPESAVVAKVVLSLLLEQNPSLTQLAQIQAPVNDLLAEVIASYGRDDDANETMILDAQGKVIMSPIAMAIARSRDAAPERPNTIAMMKEAVSALAAHLAIAGFELNPHNVNTYFHISDTEPTKDGKAAGVEQDAPPTSPTGGATTGSADGGASGSRWLPPAPRAAEAPGFRQRPASDSREPPNTHLGLMPLLLHCELRLARLHLDGGDLAEAEAVLKSAEARLARCVYLLPWLYVQFCVVKLQWRRLSHRFKLAQRRPSPDAANELVFRDPKVWAHGRCPPTDSPLFRTFMARGGAPPLAPQAAWQAEAHKPDEDGLEEFLREVVGAARVATKEGGHDYAHLFALLREGLEEVLRARGGRGGGGRAAAAADIAFALFAAAERTAECKKALHFESSRSSAAPPVPETKGKDPKGAAAVGPGMVDCAQLPPRAALDMQSSMQRQGADAELDLAYSATACQDAQKALSLTAVAKHLFALRRECDMFGSVYLGDRLLCDQLHLALAGCSDKYATAKVVDEATLAAIVAETPVAAPLGCDALVHWVPPDVGSAPPEGVEHVAFFAFLCGAAAEGEEGAPLPALIARCEEVDMAALRRLSDALAGDLQRCLPAAMVAATFLAMRLRTFSYILRGRPADAIAALVDAPSASAPPSPKSPSAARAAVDADLDTALDELLAKLAVKADGDEGGGAPPEMLDSEQVQELLRAMVRFLDFRATALKVSHQGLSAFLRAVLDPLVCLRAAPPTAG